MSDSTSCMPIGEIATHLAQADSTLAELLPPEVAARYGVIPLSCKNGRLVVGVQGRLSSLAAYDLEVLTGCKVIPVSLGGKSTELPALEESGEPAPPPTSPAKPRLKSHSRPVTEKPNPFGKA